MSIVKRTETCFSVVEEAVLGALFIRKKEKADKILSAFSFFRSNNRCYMTLITAVKTTEPTVRISIVQMTILVILENVLVCFFSRIVSTSKFYCCP